MNNNRPDEYAKVEEKLFIRYVHSTVDIEGGTLTLGETNKFLSKSELIPANKPLQHSIEVYNYKQVKVIMKIICH